MLKYAVQVVRTGVVGGYLVSEARPYGPLGEVLDGIARARNVRGPYRVASYVEERTGEGPGGSHWSQVFYGLKYPSPRVMKLFCEAFDLERGDEEFDRLALTYLDEA